MSYDIVYNTVFLRTQKGITPCILSGCNNVTEKRWTNHGYRERRARSWGIYGSYLGISEQELLHSVEEECRGGAYQEHWVENGKWLDDAGIKRWVKRNIQNAATLEDIMLENEMRSVRCYVSIWNKECDNEQKLDTYICSSSELDDWQERAQCLCEQIMQEGGQAYPTIDFVSERISFSGKPDRVIIKNQHGGFLNKIISQTQWVTSDKKEDAMVMSYEEGAAVLKKFPYWGFKIVAAPKEPKDKRAFAIKASNQNNGALRGWVYAVGRNTLSYCISKDKAKIYTGKTAVKRAIGRMTKKYPEWKFEAIEL